MQFALYDVVSAGSQQGSTLTVTGVAVAGGVFSVSLDFGAAPFATGANRFLEVRVKKPTDSSYSTLSPRQQIRAAPYSVRSVSADSADNAENLNGLPGSQYVLTTDPRLSGGGPPAPGSEHYLQNQTSTIQTAGFNISGTGKANIFDAGSQYNIGGSRVLATLGTNNLFAGVNSGRVNTGSSNSFFGRDSGYNNTSGSSNLFLGREAGYGNISGSNNTLLGTYSNVGPNSLVFATAIGSYAVANVNDTIVLGKTAGTYNGGARPADNVQVPGNIFIAGNLTVSGTTNISPSVVHDATLTGNGTEGSPLGVNTIDGSKVTGTVANAANLNGLPGSQYVLTTDPRLSGGGPPAPGSEHYIQNQSTGVQGGTFNISGNGKALTFDAASYYAIDGGRVLVSSFSSVYLGWNAGPQLLSGTGNSFLGYYAGNANTSGSGNTFVGSSTGSLNTTGGANSFVGVNAGQSNTSGNSNSFFGSSSGVSNTTGKENAFFGYFAGASNSSGDFNSFYGRQAGVNNTTGMRNTVIGENAGLSLTTGGNNTLIGSGSDVGLGNLTYATAIGAGSVANTSNTISLGRMSGLDRVRIWGLGAAGATSLCINATLDVSSCSSSLRYKKDVSRFDRGLKLIEKLRPITFTWRTDGNADLGLGAEEVAAVEPLLVTYNKDGQVEGVKYDRIGVVLINAVSEQQDQIIQMQEEIEGQKTQLLQQQRVIDGLVKLLCTSKPSEPICRKEK